MKSFGTYLVIVFSLILLGCDDDNPSIGFVFKAEKDAEPWDATRTWGSFDKETEKFYLYGYRKDGVLFDEEELLLVIDKNEIVIGKKLRNLDASLSYIVGGDGILSRYEKTENSEESYVLINSIDPFSHRIRGEFEIRVEDSGNTEKPYIHITHGKFDMPFEGSNY